MAQSTQQAQIQQHTASQHSPHQNPQRTGPDLRCSDQSKRNRRRWCHPFPWRVGCLLTQPQHEPEPRAEQHFRHTKCSPLQTRGHTIETHRSPIRVSAFPTRHRLRSRKSWSIQPDAQFFHPASSLHHQRRRRGQPRPQEHRALPHTHISTRRQVMAIAATQRSSRAAF